MSRFEYSLMQSTCSHGSTSSLRAVRGGIRRRVVGVKREMVVHEDGPRPSSRISSAGGRIRDGQRVEAVDALGVHGPLRAAPTRARSISRGLAEGLATHAVEVKLEEAEQIGGLPPSSPRHWN